MPAGGGVRGCEAVASRCFATDDSVDCEWGVAGARGGGGAAGIQDPDTRRGGRTVRARWPA